MILTKTPLRVSLVGGGTDMVEFYSKHGGAVVSFGINKYIYVALNEKFEGGYRISYSITELTNEPNEVKHDIVREALKEFKINSAEIVTIADIPGGGTGLGSSSTFAVGLVLAMRKYKELGVNRSPFEFAEQAYKLERMLCRHPVGKQDHYAAAFGGLKFYEFNHEGSVTVAPIRLRDDVFDDFQNRCMLFWMGKSRDGNRILKEQAKNFKSGDNDKVGEMLRKCAIYLAEDLQDNNLDTVGDYLKENWSAKKQMANGISNPDIDFLYDMGIQAGADGGKLCGSGGSGFMFFFAKQSKQNAVEKAVGLRRVPIKISTEGTQVIYEDGGRNV